MCERKEGCTLKNIVDKLSVSKVAAAWLIGDARAKGVKVKLIVKIRPILRVINQQLNERKFYRTAISRTDHATVLARAGHAVSPRLGHKSHQIGLDVDIWFMPMPDRVLSAEEREDISAPNMVAADGKHIYDKIWSSADIAFIRTAAEQPDVERVLVNAAIKKELCRDKSTKDQPWMSKVRPWYGHADHIHVRLKCPAKLARIVVFSPPSLQETGAISRSIIGSPIGFSV